MLPWDLYSKLSISCISSVSSTSPPLFSPFCFLFPLSPHFFLPFLCRFPVTLSLIFPLGSTSPPCWCNFSHCCCPLLSLQALLTAVGIIQEANKLSNTYLSDHASSEAPMLPVPMQLKLDLTKRSTISSCATTSEDSFHTLPTFWRSTWQFIHYNGNHIIPQSLDKKKAKTMTKDII